MGQNPSERTQSSSQAGVSQYSTCPLVFGLQGTVHVIVVPPADAERKRLLQNQEEVSTMMAVAGVRRALLLCMSLAELSSHCDASSMAQARLH